MEKKLRPNGQRANLAKIFLYIAGGTAFLSLLAEFYQLGVVNEILAADGYITFEMLESAERSDLLVLVTTILEIGWKIGVAIVFIQWFRRAYFNLHILIPKGLSNSEGMAAGAWFIPIYSLWGPMKIMSELYDRTEKLLIPAELNPSRPNRNTIKALWWTAWIASSIIGNLSYQIGKNSPGNLVTSMYLGIASSVLAIVGAFLAVKVVTHYSEMEQELPKLDEVQQDKMVDESELLDSVL